MTEVAQPSSRRHDLDALRAAAMLLGIAYHLTLSFALGFGWMVQDIHQNRGSYLFQAFVHGFRMQLFMLVSGFFTAMLWRKRGLKAFLWHRFRRVLVPCLIAVITVVPAVNWASQLAIDSSFAKSLKAALAEPASASLWAAVRKGDANALQLHLATAGALTNHHPAFGVTPLTWAALTGQTEIAVLLLSQGADVNGRNRDGGTALHAAAFLGRAEIVDLLIKSGADVQAKSSSGEVPMRSAQADYGIVEFIARILVLDVDRKQVEAGRQRIIEQLRQLGATESARQGAAAASQTWDRIIGTLLYQPVFTLVWFLWFLWWLVVVFAVYAGVIRWLDWKARPHWLVLSPASLLWLVPLTMLPTWFMGYGRGDYGPDTSMSIVPTLHVFLYYALFFFFGAIYYDCDDASGRLGRSWRWMLPIALLVVFPIALEFATGTFSLRDSLLPARFHRLTTVAFQALYAWMMTFAWMGMFRSLLTRENRTIRYLSDSSYWLYLAHLPLVIVVQTLVRDWPLPGSIKLLLLSFVVTGFLLLTYQTLVRYTWLGTLLNGPRTRPVRSGPH